MARGYDNAARERAAQETRRRIVSTARDLLLAGGYAAMTVSALATRAGVSPQTVYNSVGGKAEVVKAVYDVLMAGDDEPVTMSGRPEYLAVVRSGTPEEFLERYAAFSRMVYERVGGLLAVLLEHGPGGDPALADLVEAIDRERRAGNTAAVSVFRERFGLPPGRSSARVVDVVWTLTSPELSRRLIIQCGWSAAAYERWLAGHLMSELLTS